MIFCCCKIQNVLIGALQLPDAQHHCGKQISTRGNQLFTNIINKIFQIRVCNQYHQHSSTLVSKGWDGSPTLCVHVSCGCPKHQHENHRPKGAFFLILLKSRWNWKFEGWRRTHCKSGGPSCAQVSNWRQVKEAFVFKVILFFMFLIQILYLCFCVCLICILLCPGGLHTRSLSGSLWRWMEETRARFFWSTALVKISHIKNEAD